MTTTVLNTKISEVENKIPNTSGLLTTTVLNTKISEIENKDPLAVEQSNYLTKIVNVYIVYELYGLPKVPLKNFTLKIFCLEQLI